MIYNVLILFVKKYLTLLENSYVNICTDKNFFIPLQPLTKRVHLVCEVSALIICHLSSKKRFFDGKTLNDTPFPLGRTSLLQLPLSKGGCTGETRVY